MLLSTITVVVGMVGVLTGGVVVDGVDGGTVVAVVVGVTDRTDPSDAGPVPRPKIPISSSTTAAIAPTASSAGSTWASTPRRPWCVGALIGP